MVQRVMVIDDEPEILRVKYDILSKAGYEVEACKGPIDALISLHRLKRPDANGAPDAIISDNQMPVMNGIELLYYLSPNAKPRTLKVKYHLKGVPVYMDHPIVEEAKHVILMEVMHNADFELDTRVRIGELQGSFSGKLYLTSRSNLLKHAKSLPEGNPEKDVLETLFGFAKFFQVQEDGTGLDKLIEDLRL